MKTSGNAILITGAGTRMGLTGARAFSKRGNRVIMVARNEERLKKEAAALENADPLACDISDGHQVNSLVGHLKEAHHSDYWHRRYHQWHGSCSTQYESRRHGDRRVHARIAARN